jgi:hypothetical protein
MICLLSACSGSNGNDDFPGISDGELAYIQLHLNVTPLNSSDLYKNKLYSKYVYLFYLDGKHPKNDKPYPYAFDYGSKMICTISDVNDDPIECDYSGEFLQDTNTDGTFKLSGVTSIYKYNVTSSLNLKKGDYLIVIQTMGSYFCKKIYISPENKYAEYTLDLVQTAGGDGKINQYIWI